MASFSFRNLFSKKEDSILPSSTNNNNVLDTINIFSSEDSRNLLKEAKGKIFQKKNNAFKQKGDAHPFDFSKTIGLYKKFPYVTAVIDKTVDFTIGKGFTVESVDSRAQTIVEQFIRDTNFDYELRQWLRDALICGNGFLEIVGKKGEAPTELIVHNPEFFFVESDEFGKTKKYWQVLPKQEPIEFKVDEIAHLTMNHLSDSVYGLGVVYPNMVTIDSYLGNTKERNLLMKRKANSPIHVKLGNATSGQMPTEEAVTTFGQKLEWLRNNHEWCTDANVDMKVLDFGNIGDKFNSSIDQDMTMLVYGFQVPEALMGRGNIAEGLGKVNMETFQRHIYSIQEATEKVMESKIFRRIVQGNGLNAHVEVVWGIPTEVEKADEIARITALLTNMMLDMRLREALETKLAKLMGLEVKVKPAEEREKEEAEKQPIVPGSNNKKASPPQPKEHVHEGKCTCSKDWLKESLSEETMDYNVKEWVEFDYTQYQQDILEFLSSSDFEKRIFIGFKYVPGSNMQEWTEHEVRYALTDNLSEAQVSKLRDVLKTGFKENQSIREIAKEVTNKVQPENLKVVVPDEVDSTGKVIRRGYEMTVPAAHRAIMLSRTETVRAANQGALRNFKRYGFTEAQWVSAASERTCEYCMAQQGRVLSIPEAQERIPAHVACRCTWIPVVKG